MLLVMMIYTIRPHIITIHDGRHQPSTPQKNPDFT